MLKRSLVVTTLQRIITNAVITLSSMEYFGVFQRIVVISLPTTLLFCTNSHKLTAKEH